MVTALMFETTSVAVCEALKKMFVTACAAGVPSKQAHVANRLVRSILVFIIRFGWLKILAHGQGTALGSVESGQATFPEIKRHAARNWGMPKPGTATGSRDSPGREKSDQKNR